MENNKIIKPCGGKGICGKCKIKIIKGNITPNNRDKRFLTDEEIREGFRIACGHTIDNKIKFISMSESENFKTVLEYLIDSEEQKINDDIGNSIIIDVGTTTICFQLLDNKCNIIKTITMTNSQRVFGADVISRISKAISGGFSYLCNMLKCDIKKE